MYVAFVTYFNSTHKYRCVWPVTSVGSQVTTYYGTFVSRCAAARVRGTRRHSRARNSFSTTTVAVRKIAVFCHLCSLLVNRSAYLCLLMNVDPQTTNPRWPGCIQLTLAIFLESVHRVTGRPTLHFPTWRPLYSSTCWLYRPSYV